MDYPERLFVLAYPDARTAEAARDRVLELQRPEHITIRDMAVAENRDGKIRLRQYRSNTAIGFAVGGMWGGLIGLLVFAPFVGLALGAAAGAIGGAQTDTGINDESMKALARHLTPGAAALFVLEEGASRDRIVEALAEFGGVLIEDPLE
ncbi:MULTISPECIES: DUF1269 domain-containing protein [Glycomyces]|uniref:Putative membrane protein n=1 Tax=Glycomyces artemisiae TaxID=1076443 RepID=A0A2T0UA01_9ACTN|nr:DUF1269 domain-containing protein [Glycomyces artemisiae]PRY54763.1 putative membrane protein [Glycomyces artemisiae]